MIRERGLWAISDVAQWEWPSIEETDDTLERLACVDTVPRPSPASTRRSSSDVWEHRRRLVDDAIARACGRPTEAEQAEKGRAHHQMTRQWIEADLGRAPCRHFLVETGPGEARCRWCSHTVRFSPLHPVQFAKADDACSEPHFGLVRIPERGEREV